MKHPPATPIDIRGVKLFASALDVRRQVELVADVRHIVAAAPFFSPDTARGNRMSVRMTSAGTYGWYSDKSGYRYTSRHPSGLGWPEIPPSIVGIWKEFTGLDRRPDSCLVNFYGPNARMGMHQDRDEADFSWPVLSISLGDDGLFRIGNTTRGGKTASVWLKSGDVVVMKGHARLTYHGVDRIRPGSSTLLKDGGRLNLTLRVVE